MNYNDALNVTISEKLTKAKLIEISNILQDKLLLRELEEPPAFELISKGIKLLIKQIRYEVPLLIKDIKDAGVFTKRIVLTAMNSKSF